MKCFVKTIFEKFYFGIFSIVVRFQMTNIFVQKLNEILHYTIFLILSFLFGINGSSCLLLGQSIS